MVEQLAMPGQWDLFGAPAAVPLRPAGSRTPPPPPPLPPTDPSELLLRRCLKWMRLVDVAQPLPVELQVSTLWTGVIVETLSHPRLGRYWLEKDDTIREVPRDDAHGRFVYLGKAEARALHRRHQLIQVGAAGTHGARFRFADPGFIPDDAALAVIDRLVETANG